MRANYASKLGCAKDPCASPGEPGEPAFREERLMEGVQQRVAWGFAALAAIAFVSAIEYDPSETGADR